MTYPVVYEKPGYRNIDEGAHKNKLRERSNPRVDETQGKIGYRSGAAGHENRSREVGGTVPSGEDLRGFVTPVRAKGGAPVRRANAGPGQRKRL